MARNSVCLDNILNTYKIIEKLDEKYNIRKIRITIILQQVSL